MFSDPLEPVVDDQILSVIVFVVVVPLDVSVISPQLANAQYFKMICVWSFLGCAHTTVSSASLPE